MEKNMVKLRIEFNESSCIGAFACTAADPQRWLAGEGKAILKNGIKQGNLTVLELEADEKNKQTIIDGAQSCPVQAISVYNTETGKKIV